MPGPTDRPAPDADRLDAAGTEGRFRPPGRFEVTATSTQAIEAATADGRQHPEVVDDQDRPPTRLRVAGRVMLWRHMGKRTFGTLQDTDGRIQVSLLRDELDPDGYRALAKGVHLGDFLGVEGYAYLSNSGEPTVGAESVTVLQRALEPMPDKHAGIADADLRYRKRYLDLLVNEESRRRFLTRTMVVRSIRHWLDERGFLEVETPILTGAASGAAARPFTTHHHALDRELYLRISPETYLKRVVAGGFDRVYELGRNFRNEGIDASHLQEFTMLEWYAAYWDYRDNMTAVRELVQHVLKEAVGSTTVAVDGVDLDFGGEWPEYDYRDLVARHAGIDLRQAGDLDSLAAAIREGVAAADGPIAGDERLGEDADDAVSYAGLVDALYKRTVRPSLVQPCFLTHHPAELVPLARRSDDDPRVLDMFQVVVNGWELVKAYSELVDPVEQEQRLLEQVAMREAGDDETMMMEDDFIEAMRYGMPPMSGLGLGIDRFVALLTGAPTLRDVVLFPALREARPAEATEQAAAEQEAAEGPDAEGPDA